MCDDARVIIIRDKRLAESGRNHLPIILLNSPVSSEPGYIVEKTSVSTPFKGFECRRGKSLQGLRWKLIRPHNPALKEPGFLKGTPPPIDVVWNMGASSKQTAARTRIWEAAKQLNR